MREIKFRAKARSYGVRDWIYFSVQDILTQDAFDLEDFGEIQQYTGLKDKNGMEIYEGDIIKYMIEQDIQKNPMVVELPELFLSLGNLDPYYMIDQDSFDIIGNIYENPELLEGE